MVDYGFVRKERVRLTLEVRDSETGKGSILETVAPGVDHSIEIEDVFETNDHDIMRAPRLLGRKLIVEIYLPVSDEGNGVAYTVKEVH